MIDAWIDRNGIAHSDGNHLEIAYSLFPNSENPELSCEKAGYIKIGTMYNGSPMMLGPERGERTQAQINTSSILWENHYNHKD